MRSLTARLLLSALFSLIFSLVAIHALQAPSLPFLKLSLYSLDRVTARNDVGDMQSLDTLIAVNNQPYYGCMYLGASTPIYDAPRGIRIPVTVDRRVGLTSERVQVETFMVLHDPSLDEVVGRSAIVVLALTFLSTGIILLLNGQPRIEQILVAGSLMISSLVVLGGPDVSDFEAPYSFVYWLGLPMWGAIVLATLARWPVDQRKRKSTRAIMVVFSALAVTVAGMTLLGVPSFGCGLRGRFLAVWGYLYQALLIGCLFAQLFLLGRAYLLGTASYERAQTRALFMAVAIGLGSPIVLSLLPLMLGVRWVAPPEIMLLVAIVIPVTILITVSGTRSGVRIERYLGRFTFYSLLFVFWACLAFAAINAFGYWYGPPTAFEAAALATLPVVLFVAVLRQPYGKWLDILLYGKHYEYDKVLFKLMEGLSKADSLEGIGRYLADQMPVDLFVSRISMWVHSGDERVGFECVRLTPDCGGLPRTLMLPEEWTPSWVQEHSEHGILVLEEPLHVGGQRWDLLVLLRDLSDRNMGLILVGPKVSHYLPYGDKDVRVLSVLGERIGLFIANQKLIAEREVEKREQSLALVKYEDQIREEVAELLHDDGISSITVVRKMLDRAEAPEIIDAALHRIIHNMRRITRTHLVPAGLDLGLRPAILAVVREHEAIGSSIEANFALLSEELAYLRGAIARDLYYIVREAITNAKKHGGDDVPVKVSAYCENEIFVVEVSDRGPGFDPANTAGQGRIGRGLGFMRARAMRVGADLKVESTVGLGTTITARVPMELIKRELEESFIAELAE